MSVHQAEGLVGQPGESSSRPWGSPVAAVGPSVVGIVSGKGGVGKSALAVNLAAAAATSGARVLLVDGDLGLANADLLLGLVPRQDLGAWCEGSGTLERALCPGPGGLELLVAGDSRAAASRLRDAADGREAAGLGALFARKDLVLLDLGAGIGSAVVELASACRPVWLVATPEPTSLADAYATAKRLWERQPLLEIELVVNRSPDTAAGARTHQALGRLVRRFLDRPLPLRGVLPEDAAMHRSVAQQRPVVLHESGAAVARRLSLLAESLLDQREPGYERTRASTVASDPLSD